MRLVIEIPEEYYNGIKTIPDNQCDADMLIIKYGTPLPKDNPIEIDGRLFILEKPVLKSIDCYNLWNVYGFREVEK